MRTMFSRAGMLAAAMAAGLGVLGTASVASAGEWFWDGYRWRYAEGDYGYSRRDQAYWRERQEERALRKWERNQWRDNWDEQRGRAYREMIDTGCPKYC